MDLGLKGKVAIIGGSSKGLGRGCAVSLAQEGANIVLCANDQSSLAETAKQLTGLGVKVLPLLVDMTRKEDNEKIVRETVREFGRIDILVNNSGGPRPGTFYEFTEQDWEKAFNDVLMYVVRLCQLTIPHMKKNQWGRIVNLTSIFVKEPNENMVLSNVFRTGVVSLAKTLSRDLIKSNITINNLCPGSFKTDRIIELNKKAAEQRQVSVETIESEVVNNIPLGRYQQPKELGDLVAFLCSELAGAITGTTLQIDGGKVISLF